MRSVSLDEWTLFAEDSLAKTSRSLASVPGWPGNDQVCSGMQSLSRSMSKRDGSSWRMCPDFSTVMAEPTSPPFSPRWPTQGMATASGECWIRSSSESPNVAVECSLSQVLEHHTDPRYLLSAKAASGILRRATRRGKTLPQPLLEALTALAG